MSIKVCKSTALAPTWKSTVKETCGTELKGPNHSDVRPTLYNYFLAEGPMASQCVLHPIHAPAEAPPGVVRPGVLRGRHRATGVRVVVQRPGRVLEEGGAEPDGGEGAPPTRHPAR
ncbi:hypothetical protein CEXT_45031 [Caerostris extrusa]|uniref:Uncharacterized protein n=1 Tax=Caerostris extrusa TaxID=172846 RepID=A0AAV4URS5_CAEEX|nr:hypothetical protein CEXT_45031 [Caerostris extrusa]